LLSQTYKNIEINIGDNSENDESERIFGEYRDDNRVKYYKHDKNIGALANFQFVRDMANGKYFMWAADDDYWESTFIEKAVEKLENNPEAVACWPQVQFFDDNGVIINLPSSCYNQDLSYDSIINRLIKLNLQSSWYEFYCLIKADIVKNFDFQKYKLVGSDVIFINYIVLSGKCLFINESLFYYYYDSKNGYEKHNYKSEVYNEYARINPHLDLLINCFKIILFNEKISIHQKLLYYFKFWLKVPFKGRNWIYIIMIYPISEFFKLAIKNKNTYIIILCFPLYFYLFYINIKRYIKKLCCYFYIK